MDSDDRVLLMLGVLKAQSGHGYRLHEFIERNLSRLADLKKPTAYATLDRLVAEGLATARTEQAGKRPVRKVLELTEKGTRRYLELIRERLARPGLAGSNQDVAMLFCHDLPREELIGCLEARLAECEQRLQGYAQAPAHGAGHGMDLAVERMTRLIEADREWLLGALRRLKAGSMAAARGPGKTGRRAAAS